MKQSTLPSVCIVTPDIAEPTTCCGIGATYFALAQELAAIGHRVTILYASDSPMDIREMRSWINYYARFNVELLLLSNSSMALEGFENQCRSYSVYLWLKDKNFDYVHFPEVKGLGYYSLLSHQQGLMAHQSTFYVDLFGPTSWQREYVQQLPENLLDLELEFLERQSIEMADKLISPSKYLIDWLENKNWNLPKNKLVLQYIISPAIPQIKKTLKDSLLVKEEWLTLHNEKSNSPLPDLKETPLVSVCIPHYERPELLRQALDSLANQTYTNFEVIVVDDGTKAEGSIAALKKLEESILKELSGRLVFQDHQSANEARNKAAKLASGKYLLFMDDDNFAKPEEIETFVKVAINTEADILTCAFDRFFLKLPPESLSQPISRWLPLGNAPALGFFYNVFGDMNCMIKKEKFFELGGLSSGASLKNEDWELFARGSLKGYKLAVIPEALFWYRDHEKTLSKTAPDYLSHTRRIQPYLNQIPKQLHPLLQVSYNQQIKNINASDSLSPSSENSVFFPVAAFKSMDDFKNFSSIDPRTKLTINADGLVIESDSSDPAIQLPDFPTLSHHRLLFQIMLYSPVNGEIQLFYCSKGMEKYKETMSVLCPVEMGWNLKHIIIESDDLAGPFRFDPSPYPGRYILNSLEIFSLTPLIEMRERTMAEFLYTRRDQSRFRKKRQLFKYFDLFSDDYPGKLLPHNECEINNSEGHVAVSATGIDPAIVIDGMSLPYGLDFILEIEIESPLKTTMQVFYKTDKRPFFSEEHSLKYPLKEGRNNTTLKLPSDEKILEMRIDPGTVPGLYKLWSLNILGELP